jgi:hypothetical protein
MNRVVRRCCRKGLAMAPNKYKDVHEVTVGSSMLKSVIHNEVYLFLYYFIQNTVDDYLN